MHVCRPTPSGEGESTTVTFVNRTDTDFQLYWSKYNGEQRFYVTIPAGKDVEQQTFLGQYLCGTKHNARRSTYLKCALEYSWWVQR